MSGPVRLIIGVVAFIGGSLFCIPLVGTATAPPMPKEGWPFIGIGVLWLTVAIACFFPKTWPITLRVIGTAVFLLYAWYAFVSLWNPGRWNAWEALIVIGVPFGYMALFGRYPRWGVGAGSLQENPE
jgi:hypothetical protein